MTGVPSFAPTRVAAALSAGLNLAQYPSILVELGNMKNPADSTLMEGAEGRQRYAEAVVRGVVAFLQTQKPRPVS